MHNLNSRKKYPPNVSYFCNFNKTALSKISTHWAKKFAQSGHPVFELNGRQQHYQRDKNFTRKTSGFGLFIYVHTYICTFLAPRDREGFIYVV
jgi:hypothetical protein